MTGPSPKHHTRSFSHSFPNLFSRKKALRGGSSSHGTGAAQTSRPDGLAGQPADSSDDDRYGRSDHLSGGNGASASSTAAGSGGVGVSGRKLDFQTGHCQTCDTKVRWPAGVATFRCVECQMVNDGVPVLDGTDPDGPVDRTAVLSVEHTRATIQSCIAAYLRARLDGPAPDSVRFGRMKLSTSPARRSPVRKAVRPDDPDQPEQHKTTMPPPPPPVRHSTFPLAAGHGHGIGIGTALSPTRRNVYLAADLGSSQSSSQTRPVVEIATGTMSGVDNLGPASATGSYGSSRIGSPMVATPVIITPDLPPGTVQSHDNVRDGREGREDRSRRVFGPLEEYVISHYGRWKILNASFHTGRNRPPARTQSESSSQPSGSWQHKRPAPPAVPANSAPFSVPPKPPGPPPPPPPPPPQPTQNTGSGPAIDAKLLLAGNIAENGSWWTGRQEPVSHVRSDSHGRRDGSLRWLATSKSGMVNWPEMMAWYDSVLSAGRGWIDIARQSVPAILAEPETMADIELEIQQARIHLHKTLLKVTEMVLKRPGRPVYDYCSVRFLFIILANPLFHPSLARRYTDIRDFHPAGPGDGARLIPPSSATSSTVTPTTTPPFPHTLPPAHASHRRQRSADDRPSLGMHAGIVKRIVGLLSNISLSAQRVLVAWFVRYPDEWVRRIVDLIGNFVTYRLMRQESRKGINKARMPTDPTVGLIPRFNTAAGSVTTVQLHAALGLSNSAGTGLLTGTRQSGTPTDRRRTDEAGLALQPPLYSDDWQIRAAARVMAILFAANAVYSARRGASRDAGAAGSGRIRAPGQLLATSHFYSALLDYSPSLLADFDGWQSGRFGPSAFFFFCHYPFFLSIGAKIRVLQHDARRQMETKAREAFFDSLLTRRSVDQFFNMRVRRDCLADDSLTQISESVASGLGLDEVKKGLRVQFVGEEGIDAGGLRKEWFLLLVRDLFDPNKGMFVYDDESRYCYFNSFTFERADQFYLVGAILGLAIYNSTILDVQLPPFAFRKLLAAAPPPLVSAVSSPDRYPVRALVPPVPFNPTINDLAELNPVVAASLRQLLDFEPTALAGGDEDDAGEDAVVATFGLTFAISVDRYGSSHTIHLVPNGDRVDVTMVNRHEFVNLYVRHLLIDSVVRQFEPFKRGFWSICQSNAIDLFRPEEVELLVRGADEPLNVASLQAVAIYDGFEYPDGTPMKQEEVANAVPVVGWFWQMLDRMEDQDRRRVVGWITGSDRVPAVGAASMVIKVSSAGPVGSRLPDGREVVRLPVARTCFNMIQLPLYLTREQMEEKVWQAVTESGGFGLK